MQILEHSIIKSRKWIPDTITIASSSSTFLAMIEIGG